VGDPSPPPPPSVIYVLDNDATELVLLPCIFFLRGKRVKLKGPKITIAGHNTSQLRRIICKPKLRAMEDPAHLSKLMSEAVRLSASLTHASFSFLQELADAAYSEGEDQ
jgi:hypothetical protein